MSHQLADIALRRGRLLERIAGQRADLGRRMQPVKQVLDGVDRGVLGVRRGARYLKNHPGIVVACLAALAVLKPRRVWRWGRRGFIAWRTWRALRLRVAELVAWRF